MCVLYVLHASGAVNMKAFVWKFLCYIQMLYILIHLLISLFIKGM